MSIAITAVVCTLDRADYLVKALESLVRQSLPREAYEILVVDNGSTADTEALMSGQFGSVSNLRYIEEPMLGLSQARNTGWQSAKGEYVAYLDDDAIASPNWLEKILHVFSEVKPRPGCVGGRVRPIWEAPQPRWLSNKMASYLTIVDWSETPFAIGKNEWVAGANMAFPRDLLDSIGGFYVGLDRKGNNLLSMGDILLQRQLEAKGYCCFYHPDIEVGHHVPASRLTKNWFTRRTFWQGVSLALAQVYQHSLSAADRWKIGMKVAKEKVLSRKPLLQLMLPTDDPDRFAFKCKVLERVGYVLGLWGIAR